MVFSIPFAVSFAVASIQEIGFPVLVVLAWIAYHVRARSLARAHRPVRTWRQVCFASGLAVLLIAASPPVDTLSDQLLVAHMAAHAHAREHAGHPALVDRTRKRILVLALMVNLDDLIVLHHRHASLVTVRGNH